LGNLSLFTCLRSVKSIAFGVAIVSVAGLTACGGGGGSSSGGSSETPVTVSSALSSLQSSSSSSLSSTSVASSSTSSQKAISCSSTPESQAITASLWVAHCEPTFSSSSSTRTTYSPINNPVTISGTVTYDYIPSNYVNVYDTNNTLIGKRVSGWNVSGRAPKPVQGVTVQVWDENNVVLSETFADENGAFKISAPKSTKVRVVAVAEFYRSSMTLPSYRITVVDPLAGTAGNRPIYHIDGDLVATLSTDETRNLYAPFTDTMLGDASYNPAGLVFAVLNNASSILTAWANTGLISNFPDLKIEWNPNSQITVGSADYNSGTSTVQLTGYVRGQSTPEDFMYGSAIAHEMGHYFIDKFVGMLPTGSVHNLKGSIFSTYNEAIANTFAQVTLNEDFMANDSLWLSGNLWIPTGYLNDIDLTKCCAQGVFSEFNVSYLIQSALRGDVKALIQTLLSEKYRSGSAATTLYLFQNALADIDSVKAMNLLSQMKQFHIFGEGAYGAGESYCLGCTGTSTLGQYIFPFYLTLNENSPTRACTSKSGATDQYDMANIRALTLNVTTPGFYNFTANKVTSDFSVTTPQLVFKRSWPYATEFSSNYTANVATMSSVYLGLGTYTVFLYGETNTTNLQMAGQQVSCYDVSVAHTASK